MPSSFQAIAYRNRSIAHAVMGNFERAENDYREAIALDPSYRKSAVSDKDDSERPRASVELSLSEPDKPANRSRSAGQTLMVSLGNPFHDIQ